MPKAQTKQNTEDIKKLLASHQEHLIIANQEMGVVKADMLEIKASIKSINEHVFWIKSIYATWEKKVDKLDDRTWWILGTIIVGFLVNLYFK